MLLLYCERSLIAPALPTASQTSQHGALAACLISHCLGVIHCKKKKRERGRKKEKRQERLEKSLRSRGCERAAAASSSLQPRHLFSVGLQLGAFSLLPASQDQCAQSDFPSSSFHTNRCSISGWGGGGDDAFTVTSLVLLLHLVWGQQLGLNRRFPFMSAAEMFG